ncbi:MAG: hypothetical protein WCV73_02835 [Patescibacteria group bacterium]|jgi:hypothetical protein
MDKVEKGLNFNNRRLIVIIFVFILLFWGPIEPFGLVIRIAYVILLPILLWYFLKHFGQNWDGGKLANDRLTRGIIGIIAGVLFVGAYFYATSKYHTECTQEIQTRDGIECVGDYVPVKGPDHVNAIFLVALGITATWYSIFRRNED